MSSDKDILQFFLRSCSSPLQREFQKTKNHFLVEKKMSGFRKIWEDLTGVLALLVERVRRLVFKVWTSFNRILYWQRPNRDWQFRVGKRGIGGRLAVVGPPQARYPLVIMSDKAKKKQEAASRLTRAITVAPVAPTCVHGHIDTIPFLSYAWPDLQSNLFFSLAKVLTCNHILRNHSRSILSVNHIEML
eukprot:g29716.t1